VSEKIFAQLFEGGIRGGAKTRFAPPESPATLSYCPI
jgi:hypothetical protein